MYPVQFNYDVPPGLLFSAERGTNSLKTVRIVKAVRLYLRRGLPYKA